MVSGYIGKCYLDCRNSDRYSSTDYTTLAVTVSVTVTEPQLETEVRSNRKFGNSYCYIFVWLIT